MTLKKLLWIIPGLFLVVVSVASWWVIPHYAETRFIEKLKQIGIETDSIEFRIEGLSRPVVRDLRLHIAGLDLATEVIEFGSLFEGYGEDQPLKMTIKGFWAGINAKMPQGVGAVNKAISELPQSESFAMPIPVRVVLEKGDLHYQNRGRQIAGTVHGELFLEGTKLDWKLDIEAEGNPLTGAGVLDWESGWHHFSGDVEVDHRFSQSIWDIFDVEPWFNWHAGAVRTDYYFEGDLQAIKSGHMRGRFSDVSIHYKGMQLSQFNNRASLDWTPGLATVDFSGEGRFEDFLNAAFNCRGRAFVEAGPAIQMQLDAFSFSSSFPIADLHLERLEGEGVPVEVAVLADEDGVDFQFMGLDLDLSAEMSQQLGFSEADLMINARVAGDTLKQASADIWLQDGLFLSPVLQADFSSGEIHAAIDQAMPLGNLGRYILNAPRKYLSRMAVEEGAIYRFDQEVARNVSMTWFPGEDGLLNLVGDFQALGALDLTAAPGHQSTWQRLTGVLTVNPGDIHFNYSLRADEANGLLCRLFLPDYQLEDFNAWDRWLANPFHLSGNASGQAELALNAESFRPEITFTLRGGYYERGGLILDTINGSGTVQSLGPFSFKTSEPITIAHIGAMEWEGINFETDLEIAKRINVFRTRIETLGGSVQLADISMGREEMFIESEIGVTDIKAEEVLPYIPNVVGLAEGTISGVLPFQWDLKNNDFSLGRGNLSTPTGEKGFMSLKVFRDEESEKKAPRDQSRFVVDSALANLKDSSVDIDILPPNAETAETRVRLNIKGYLDTRLVKAPVDVVQYYELPMVDFDGTMHAVKNWLPQVKQIP